MRRDLFHEWPLVFFTLLTQLAVGAFLLWGLAAMLVPAPNPFSTGLVPASVLLVVLLALGSGALAASFHLGRKIGAVFSLSNWRTSWLSREAMFSAGFGLLALAALGLQLTTPGFGWLDRLVILLGTVAGIALVLMISRLYRLRTVPAWDHWGTPVSFLATSLMTGAVMLRLIWLLSGRSGYGDLLSAWTVRILGVLILVLVAVQILVFGIQTLELTHKSGAGAESVRLMWGKYRLVVVSRWLAAGFGAFLPILGETVLLILLASLLLLSSEILGRFLFYAAYRREGF